jgi:hypothetical protein
MSESIIIKVMLSSCRDDVLYKCGGRVYMHVRAATVMNMFTLSELTFSRVRA